MKMSDIIRKRRSVRTFDGRVLADDDVKKILEYAVKVENPFDIPIEWKMLNAQKDGLSSPVISGTDTYIAGKMRKTARAEEAFGYAFEKIVLFAESLGIGTTWIAGTMDRKAFERAMNLQEDEVLPCVSPLGYPAPKMSLRETMMRKGIKADKRKDFDHIFFDADFEHPLSREKAGKLEPVLEMVRLAPSAVNLQPWRLVVDGDKVHFYEVQKKSMSDGNWDIQKIDMGIALCHFEAGAAECGISAALSTEDPGLASENGPVYIATFCIS